MDFHAKPPSAKHKGPLPPGAGASFVERLQYELLRKRGSHWAAFVSDLSLGFGFCIALAIMASLFLGALGVDSGTGSEPILAMFTENALFMTLFAVVFVPPVEEAIFRLLPRVIGSYWFDARHPQWALGIAMAILFGFAHIDPSSLTLPLPQMIAGLAFWYMQWRHGFFGAVCLHAVFNGTIFLMLALTID